MIRDAGVLLRAAWRHSRGKVSLQAVLLLATGLLGGASLVLLIPIVNSLADSGSTADPLVVGGVEIGPAPLWLLLLAFVVVVSVQAGVAYASAVTTTTTQQRLVDHLREEAFAAVLSARWTFILRQRRSDIVAVVSVGASRAGMAYNQMLQAAVAAVLAVVTAVVALIVSPVIAAVAIAGVLLLALALSITIRPAHRLGVELGGRQRELQAVITDSLDSLRVIRAHSASAVWIERLADAFAGARDVQVANVRRQSRVAGLTSVGTAIAAAVLVLVAVALDVSPADLVIVLLLVVRLAQHARGLVSSLATMANALPAVRELEDLTGAARSEVEHVGDEDRGPIAVPVGDPLVSFRSVGFAYPDGGGSVASLTFDVPRGSMTVLTGPSGVGKTTAVDLALGLLTPDTGAVTVGGVDLTADALPWWRRQVAYVPQDTVLVPGTVRENLVWSLDAPADDDACRRALADAALDLDLDTQLGDRGARLSGGERQRVAIARALLRQPDLLVLDEATNALDEATEAEVMAVLRGLLPRVTLLVVAHRPVPGADHVVRLP
jgi:ATP-binding cassette subfamily C protein